MARPHHKLTTVSIRALNAPGRHADGDGLYLYVDPRNSTKRWVLRTVVNGHRRDIGLGSISTRTLGEAREEAARLRRMARMGQDPRPKIKVERPEIPTFETAARTVHAQSKESWRNPKHRAQWMATLETYAFPQLGKRLVSEIETRHIHAVLLPIWREIPETARRLRQRMSVVFDWAKTMGHRAGDNPVDAVTKGLPAQGQKKKNHAALSYADVANFIQTLRDSDSTVSVRLAFEFAILTAARTGEIIGARWEEFDEQNAVWTIPASRMKVGRVHRVPLVPRCIEILSVAKTFEGGEFVFPGRRHKKPLSQQALLMALRRIVGGQDLTVHGFRSTFMDWAADNQFDYELREAALAHAVKNKTEAAYRRTDFLEQRRPLMAAWAAFALPKPVAEIVQFPRAVANG